MKHIFQSWEFIFLITIIVTSIIIAYAFLILKAINNYNLRSLELLRNYDNLKATQKRMLLETEIEIREETFQYISKEIHDNITQSLSLAHLIINCLNKDTADFKIQLDKCKYQISKALNDLNDLSKSLDSDLIESHGLTQAVIFEIEKCKRLYPIEFSFTTNGQETTLETTKELFLFRIIQESLNNILKHANASNIEISFDYTGTEIKTKIKDDGIGFNLETLYENKEAGKMAGLKNMHQRAEIIGGSLNLISNPIGGTIIEVQIPYKHEQQNYSWTSRRS